MSKSILCTLLLAVLLAGPLYALNMDGLVMYLPLDEGSGDTAGDGSGSGNDG